jgi:hypothetical protein
MICLGRPGDDFSDAKGTQNLLIKAWSMDMHERPTMQEVCIMMKQIIVTLRVSPSLQLPLHTQAIDYFASHVCQFLFVVPANDSPTKQPISAPTIAAPTNSPSEQIAKCFPEQLRPNSQPTTLECFPPRFA